MKESDKVGIIILNYNGAKDTIACVDSLGIIKCPNEIIVVDNKSSDNSYQILRNELSPDVKVIQNKKNLGYAGGNNEGIKIALEDGCQFICVLNNDTEATMDFLTPCIKELKENSDTAFVGPTIIDYKEGFVQASGGLVNPSTGSIKTLNWKEQPANVKVKTFCDYVHGACIVCRKDVIQRFGMIPECYFLFFEETEWCYRAKKAGYKNVCLGTCFIKHKGSATINKVGGLNEYIYHRNLIVFIRRNAPTTIIAFLAYQRLCLEEKVKSILKRDEKYERRIRAYKDGWMGKMNYKKYPFVIIHD